jgi:hypothetical protein
MQPTQRPAIVTVLGIISIVRGLLSLFGGACVSALAFVGLGQLLGGAAGGVAANQTAAGAGVVIGVLGLISAILALGSIVIGAGLLQLKQWAYRIALILAVISIVLDVVSIIIALSNGGNLSQALTGQIAPIAINVLIIYWLSRPDVKQAFGAA